MNFLTAAIETASNNASTDNAVVVATDAIQTIKPSEGLVSSAVHFISDNKKAIAVTAVTAATVYVGVKYIAPAVRRAFTKESNAKADLNKAKATKAEAPKHERTRDEEILMMQFKKAHHSTVLSLPFDTTWNNGTGYFNGVTSAELNLKPGQYFKSTCPETNRRIIGKVLSKGKNVVVFERYTPSVNTAFKLVANLPDGVRIPEMTSELNLDTFHKFMDGEI